MTLVLACHLAAILLATPGAPAPLAQFPRPNSTPLPAGQRIVAHDGDVVVVEDDARVKVVRRRDANVRVIYNEAQHWLVVIADYLARGGTDGRVDASYTFNNLAGDWPLEARWEGTATLEDYSAPGKLGGGSFGIVTPQGLVQVVNQGQGAWLKEPGAIAVLTSRGSGRSNGPSGSFDDVERRQVESATRNAERNPSVASGFRSSVSMSASGPTAGAIAAIPGEQAPVRVGNTIRPPVKTVDVKPTTPDAAVSADIHGVVILELTIDADGTIKQARVLRSIPMLDEAALTAARQWRYEPTLLDGRAVPVVITATVLF